jgi:hypothetical protein
MFSSIAATPVGLRQHFADLDILIDRRPADVDEGARAGLVEQRQLLRDEAVHADALEADRVDHAGGRFDDPRWRMALALFHEEPFGHHAAEHRGDRRLLVFEA